MYTDQPAPAFLTKTRRVVFFPIGSCEQHGPYLPIDTDLRIAQLLAEKLTQTFPKSNALLLPSIPFSCSWEHKGLGTIMLNVSTLAAIIHDVAFSLKTWETPSLIILINWHGGNSSLGSLAAEITAKEDIPTAVFNPISQAEKIWKEKNNTNIMDVHAGAVETSIIQAYWPELIAKNIPQSAHYEPEINPLLTQTVLQSLNSRTITKEGIWGAPEQANAYAGTNVVETLIKDMHNQTVQLLELVNKYQD